MFFLKSGTWRVQLLSGLAITIAPFVEQALDAGGVWWGGCYVPEQKMLSASLITVNSDSLDTDIRDTGVAPRVRAFIIILWHNFSHFVR